MHHDILRDDGVLSARPWRSAHTPGAAMHFSMREGSACLFSSGAASASSPDSSGAAMAPGFGWRAHALALAISQDWPDFAHAHGARISQHKCLLQVCHTGDFVFARLGAVATEFLERPKFEQGPGF